MGERRSYGVEQEHKKYPGQVPAAQTVGAPNLEIRHGGICSPLSIGCRCGDIYFITQELGSNRSRVDPFGRA